jgi:hypothetical protein
MKNILFYSLFLILVLTVSACGAQPVPTVNPVDIQHTAEAAAFTIVAQTQEAIPTSTPIPPTETPTNTPAVTDTPLTLPTLAVSATVAVPTSSSGTDPCATRVLSNSPRGRNTIIRIANLTRVTMNVSLYLNETAGAGECGYRSYTISKANDVVIGDLVQGCYNLWAWSNDNRNPINVSGYGCINNDDKWTFEIRESSIKFTGP